MKKVLKRIRMRRAASKRKSKSLDPIKAYKARLEVGIYTWLLDLIAKEIEAEEEANAPDEVTVTKTIAGVQTV